jgi:integrase
MPLLISGAPAREQAVEYGYLDRNPAKGRKRLLKEDKPTRGYLQQDQVAALLSAAGKIDADAREGDTRRCRPLLATLTLAGLRISEALDLCWRDVNLDARRLRVAAAKTDAGVREVDLTPALQELLADYRSRSPYTQPGDLVFPTGAGKRDNPPTSAIVSWTRRRGSPTPICGQRGGSRCRT